MILQEAMRRINFKIGTPDDFSGRAINPIVNNRVIIDELNFQMLQYADITKGIQDVFSFAIDNKSAEIPAPPLALRSESYWSLMYISNATLFLMDMRRQSEVFRIFINSPINGIVSFVLPWNEGNKSFLSTYPTASTGFISTTLTSDLLSTDTTIPVASTSGQVSINGRISIGDEKIQYTTKDTINFLGCRRGTQQTTATFHSSTTEVKQNNIIIYYSRKAVPIDIKDDNIISSDLLARDLEIVDEHMEGVIKGVAYNILIKLDTERVRYYKDESIELYNRYHKEIKRGYYRGRQGTGVRDPYILSEMGSPYGATWRL